MVRFRRLAPPSLQIGLFVRFATPPIHEWTIDRGLQIRQAAELDVELAAVRSSELFNTIESRLKFVASARAQCIFPGQIHASARRFSKSHTRFVVFSVRAEAQNSTDYSAERCFLGTSRAVVSAAGCFRSYRGNSSPFV
jgi:hypothetical protein